MEDIIAWHKITGNIPDFLAVLESGFIKPSGASGLKISQIGLRRAAIYKQKYNIRKKNPLINPIDILAGDGNKVFLALYPLSTTYYFPERYLKRKIFGDHYQAIGFPLTTLINDGAEVGKEDLAPKYRSVFTEVIVNNLDGNISTPIFNNITNDFDAFYPIAKEFGLVGKIEQEMKRVQDKYRFKGEAALDYIDQVVAECWDAITDDPYEFSEEQLRKCGASSKFNSVEILYPGPLSLDLAEYVIVEGKVFTIEDLENL